MHSHPHRGTAAALKIGSKDKVWGVGLRDPKYEKESKNQV